MCFGGICSLRVHFPLNICDGFKEYVPYMQDQIGIKENIFTTATEFFFLSDLSNFLKDVKFGVIESANRGMVGKLQRFGLLSLWLVLNHIPLNFTTSEDVTHFSWFPLGLKNNYKIEKTNSH